MSNEVFVEVSPGLMALSAWTEVDRASYRVVKAARRIVESEETEDDAILLVLMVCSARLAMASNCA